MTDLIFHHYPQSPVAEKVRISLGIKGATWQSVTIPRIPPKPDLMPLTGGYRRTPVLQVGADIYCDSQCILDELEKRIPSPTFFPDGNAGLTWALSRWSDTEVFTTAIAIVLGAGVDDLPPEFAKDRGRLYFGPDSDFHKINADLPHIVGQLRGHLNWVEDQLGSGAKFLSGDAPGLADALVYYLCWFIHGRWDKGPELISSFTNLNDWFERVGSVGHGTSTPLDSKDALAIARGAAPQTTENVDASDPLQLTVGDTIKIRPDVDGGDPDVVGRLMVLTPQRVAIGVQNETVNEICVHFPRVGYRVSKL